MQLYPEAIIVARGGRIRFANARALELSGFSNREMLGRRCLSLVLAEDRKAAIRGYRELNRPPRTPLAGAPATRARALALRVTDRMDAYRWVEIRQVTTTWDGALGTLLFASDVTEKKQLELQFLQAQKMEAVGRLAGGIAHDVNNMLTVILGQSELLLARGDMEEHLHAGLAEIHRAAENAGSVVQQLLLFSRRRQNEPRVISLNDLIEGMDAMLRRLVGEGIRVEKHLDPALGAIRADPPILEQAVLNLAVNARDAMERGGTLILSTANTEVVDTVLPRLPDLPPGWYVTLSVVDTGVGMDEATLERLFEPFFTTKDSGKGTGLGLSTVYGIVKQCDGAVHVYSRPGHGSSFRLYFPRVDRAPDPERGHQAPHVPASGSETLLLVEDDPQVRALILQVLRESGYTVLEASGGAEALELCRSGRNPDLVITDVGMPGLDGHEVWSAVHSLVPEARVLFISGYPQAPEDTGGRETAPFIQKPFSGTELLSKVRGLLDTRPA